MPAHLWWNSPLWLGVAAALGCLLGRLLGPRLKVCPFKLSAQLAAAAPILLGIFQGAEQGPTGLLAGGAAAAGVFLSGHGSRTRSCLFAFLSSLAAVLLLVATHLIH